MVTSTSFPILGYVAVFLFVKISANETTVSCPKGAIVDLTRTVTDSPGYPEKLGKVYPPNSTWSRGDEKLGCLCTSKTCIPLCCNLTDARHEGICVKDLSVLSRNITFIHEDYQRQEIPEQYYRSFKNDPCAFGWMRLSLMKNVSVFKNGSIYAPEFNGGPILDLDQYCLMREPKSTRYVAKVCQPWVKKGGYEISCVILAILIMLANLITYTKAHRSRNLHGLIFRSYIATYVMLYVFALGAMYTTELRINPFWFSFFEITGRCFCGSCTLWLTLMNFTIWRSFRDLRPRLHNFEAEERKKFIWYAMCAWIIPFQTPAATAVMKRCMPFLRNETNGETWRQWRDVAGVILTLVCNTFLYTSTALTIRKQKKDLAGIVNSVNRHHEMNKRWFNLYSKLFVMMGAHLVVWPIFLVWPTRGMQYLLATIEVLQSLLIFIMFIWNDNVKRSLRERLDTSWIISSIRKITFRRLPTQNVAGRENGLRSCEVELN